MIATLLVVLFYPAGVVLLYVAALMYGKTDGAMARRIRRVAIVLTILPVLAFAGLLLAIGLRWH